MYILNNYMYLGMFAFLFVLLWLILACIPYICILEYKKNA